MKFLTCSLILCLFCVGGLSAGSADTAVSTPRAKGKISKKATSKVPQMLLEIEKKYSKSKTLSAHFTQSVTKPEWNVTGQQSSGMIYVRRPNQYRWETKEPNEHLLIFTGKSFINYSPPFENGDRGEYSVQKAKGQPPLLSALLMGSFSSAKEMTVESITDVRYALTPKSTKGAGGVKRAEIVIDSLRKVIEKVSIEFEGGNKTEVSLSSIRFGDQFPKGLFDLQKPANADQFKN